MNYLLDTNVVSEWIKPAVNVRVVQWLTETSEENLFLSVFTFAEIYQGVAQMTAGRRRDALIEWLQRDLVLRFERRIIGVDLSVAQSWGTIMARSVKTGVNLNPIDAFFAATADVHGMTLVTRNIRHFRTLGVTLLNPWDVRKT